MAWPDTFTIKVRRDDSAAWNDTNPTLTQGEIGWEIDTRMEKVGDGITPWRDLPYRSAEFFAETSGTTLNLDGKLPGTRMHTMTGNTTITISDGPTSRSLTIAVLLTQGGSGGNTATWPAAIYWLAGAPPAPVADGGPLLVELRWIGGTWIGRQLT